MHGYQPKGSTHQVVTTLLQGSMAAEGLEVEHMESARQFDLSSGRFNIHDSLANHITITVHSNVCSQSLRGIATPRHLVSPNTTVRFEVSRLWGFKVSVLGVGCTVLD